VLTNKLENYILKSLSLPPHALSLTEYLYHERKILKTRFLIENVAPKRSHQKTALSLFLAGFCVKNSLPMPNCGGSASRNNAIQNLVPAILGYVFTVLTREIIRLAAKKTLFQSIRFATTPG